MWRSKPKSGPQEKPIGEGVEWELLPGGMLVQKRSGGVCDPKGPLIKVKVAHGSSQREVTVPAQATFGELKMILAQETGLDPQAQRVLFRGKEKDDDECLHMAGVKDMSKVLVLEDPANKERKIELTKRAEGVRHASEAVARVHTEVNKLAQKVSALESAVHGGNKIAEKEFNVLTELLMLQLLKLDSIEAEGEAKVQRRTEVRRVQGHVDTLDRLKARNANPSSNNSNTMSVTTQWQAFESGFGSLNAPRPSSSSVETSSRWELDD